MWEALGLVCLWHAGGWLVCLVGGGWGSGYRAASQSVYTPVHAVQPALLCWVCRGPGQQVCMQLQCIAACVAATRAAAVLAGCQQVGFTFSCSSAFTKHIFGRKLARVCSQAVWISVHGAPWPTACADVCWRGGAGVNFSCCVADCLSWSLHVALLGGGRRLSGWLDCGRVHAACVPGYLA